MCVTATYFSQVKRSTSISASPVVVGIDIVSDGPTRPTYISGPSLSPSTVCEEVSHLLSTPGAEFRERRRGREQVLWERRGGSFWGSITVGFPSSVYYLVLSPPPVTCSTSLPQVLSVVQTGPRRVPVTGVEDDASGLFSVVFFRRSNEKT